MNGWTWCGPPDHILFPCSKCPRTNNKFSHGWLLYLEWLQWLSLFSSNVFSSRKPSRPSGWTPGSTSLGDHIPVLPTLSWGLVCLPLWTVSPWGKSWSYPHKAPLNPHPFLQVSAIISHDLQRWQLMLREVRWLVYRHTAGRQQIWDSSLGVPESKVFAFNHCPILPQ